MSAATFQRERVRQVRESGLDALLKAHWAELAHYPDIDLKVRWDAYLAAEDYGSLRAYTARIDGELVGYAAFLVRANPHYSDSLQANQDVLFLHPDHRKGRIGLQLIKFVEEIGITGGEPTLLGDRLFTLLRALKAQLPQTAVHILTNGRTSRDLSLAQEFAKLKHPDLMLGVPIYSDIPAIHDFIVQADGAYDETLRGIINLKRCGVRVEIRVVIHILTTGCLT